MMTLNGFVTGRLADIGKTKTELAGACGFSTVSLASKLSGKTEFTLGEAIAMADFIGCTLEELASFVRR